MHVYSRLQLVCTISSLFILRTCTYTVPRTTLTHINLPSCIAMYVAIAFNCMYACIIACLNEQSNHIHIVVFGLMSFIYKQEDIHHQILAV